MQKYPRILAMAAALSVFAGCFGPGHKWGESSTSTIGKENAYAISHTTCDDRVFLVLVADGCKGSSSNSASSATGFTSTGQLTALDGRQLPWSLATSDGKSGSVKIENQTFDLAKGGIFLVSTKDKQTKVEQVAVDMAKLQGGPVEQKLTAVGETEPRIGAFLKSCRGEK